MNIKNIEESDIELKVKELLQDKDIKNWVDELFQQKVVVTLTRSVYFCC